jgi:hypothetical protein
MEFEYIKTRYNVPAELNREIMYNGKKGIISKDMGNYLGIVLYDDKNKSELVAHPTWEMIYLDTFGKVPKPKNNRSKLRYMEYLNDDSGFSFKDWLKNKCYTV